MVTDVDDAAEPGEGDGGAQESLMWRRTRHRLAMASEARDAAQSELALAKHWGADLLDVIEHAQWFARQTAEENAETIRSEQLLMSFVVRACRELVRMQGGAVQAHNLFRDLEATFPAVVKGNLSATLIEQLRGRK